MTHSFDKIVTKEFAGKTVDERLDAAPSALRGVSAADARSMADTPSIHSVRQLAESAAPAQARAILAAAGRPGFDPGPPPAWEVFFDEAPLSYYIEHPKRRFRTEFGPVYYRGRLDGSARVLVIGQDPSTNELLAHRVFVGRSGQRVQGFLRKLGVTRSYLMLNTFLYCVYGQYDAELRRISSEGEILAYRNQYLDRVAAQSSIEAIITIGAGARSVAELWPAGRELPAVHMVHPAADEAMVMPSWNDALPALQELVKPDDDGEVDATRYESRFRPQDEVDIPRFDLPFGVPPWQGHGGNSRRDGDKVIIWNAP
jgi:uracil-DNA glycosylase